MKSEKSFPFYQKLSTEHFQPKDHFSTVYMILNIINKMGKKCLPR